MPVPVGVVGVPDDTARKPVTPSDEFCCDPTKAVPPVAVALLTLPPPAAPNATTWVFPPTVIVPALDKSIRALPPLPLPALPPVPVPPPPLAKTLSVEPNWTLLPTEAAATALPPIPAPAGPPVVPPPWPAAWIVVAPVIAIPELAAT